MPDPEPSPKGRFSWVHWLLVAAIVVILGDLLRQPIRKPYSICDAAIEGNLAKVKEMLEREPKLMEYKEGHHGTPLLCAAGQCKKDVVEFLLSKGAKVTARNWLGRTSLHAACHCDKDLIELLLANGADVNATDYDGITPTHWAIQWGSKEAADLLHQH